MPAERGDSPGRPPFASHRFSASGTASAFQLTFRQLTVELRGWATRPSLCLSAVLPRMRLLPAWLASPLTGNPSAWCAWPDSNRHARRQPLLKRSCLPFPTTSANWYLWGDSNSHAEALVPKTSVSAIPPQRPGAETWNRTTVTALPKRCPTTERSRLTSRRAMTPRVSCSARRRLPCVQGGALPLSYSRLTPTGRNRTVVSPISARLPHRLSSKAGALPRNLTGLTHLQGGCIAHNA